MLQLSGELENVCGPCHCYHGSQTINLQLLLNKLENTLADKELLTSSKDDATTLVAKICRRLHSISIQYGQFLLFLAIFDSDRGDYVTLVRQGPGFVTKLVEGKYARMRHWIQHPEYRPYLHLCGHGFTKFGCDNYLHEYASTVTLVPVSCPALSEYRL